MKDNVHKTPLFEDLQHRMSTSLQVLQQAVRCYVI